MSLTKAMGCARAEPIAQQSAHFYPTPPEGTIALLESVYGPPGDFVWEPACGDGAICRVLEARGFDVKASDVSDRGYGKTRVDFLGLSAPWADQIVTNPPFGIAHKFIEHAHRLGVSYAAFLLKSNYYSAARRLPLFARFRPRAVLPLTWRLDFTGDGSPTMDCAWFVFDRSGRPTAFEPLPRPVARHVETQGAFL